MQSSFTQRVGIRPRVGQRKIFRTKPIIRPVRYHIWDGRSATADLRLIDQARSRIASKNTNASRPSPTMPPAHAGTIHFAGAVRFPRFSALTFRSPDDLNRFEVFVTDSMANAATIPIVYPQIALARFETPHPPLLPSRGTVIILPYEHRRYSSTTRAPRKTVRPEWIVTMGT